MASNLTFEQINETSGKNIFIVDNGNILMNLSTLTGDTFSSLTNEGIIECAYKFLLACYNAQKQIEAGNIINPLNSFSPPVYSTVSTQNTMEVTLSVTGTISLSYDDITGTNQ